MSRERVGSYFDLLQSVLEEHQLFDKLGSIFNMDEMGLQLNNVASHVLTTRGSKVASSIISSEKVKLLQWWLAAALKVTLYPQCALRKQNLRMECLM